MVTGVASSLRSAVTGVRKCGRIVLIGSTAARSANPGQGAYAASKAGLEALCRVAALELARYNITCNVVAPGPIESRMMRHVPEAVVTSTLRGIPLRRLGHPAEVASTVCHLLGAEAGYTTGQALQIDGGLSAR